MDASQIISLVGLPTIEQETGATRTAIAKWRIRGIPSKFWPGIARAAERVGAHQVTIDALEAHKAGERPAPTERAA